MQKRQEKAIERMDKEYEDFPKILDKVQAEAKSLRVRLSVSILA
jgi:predicted nucleic acid-binding Zn finger protein